MGHIIITGVRLVEEVVRRTSLATRRSERLIGVLMIVGCMIVICLIKGGKGVVRGVWRVFWDDKAYS